MLCAGKDIHQNLRFLLPFYREAIKNENVSLNV